LCRAAASGWVSFGSAMPRLTEFKRLDEPLDSIPTILLTPTTKRTFLCCPTYHLLVGLLSLDHGKRPAYQFIAEHVECTHFTFFFPNSSLILLFEFPVMPYGYRNCCIQQPLCLFIGLIHCAQKKPAFDQQLDTKKFPILCHLTHNLLQLIASAVNPIPFHISS
jgi:hypothetical protein